MINLTTAIAALKSGGIIAYPTEGVFGLGCDPQNTLAIERLLALKQRPSDKGFILIASDWKQLQPYLQPLTSQQMQRVMQTWPGPVTWVIPAADSIPGLLKGMHNTLAVRITSHPIAAQLCREFGGAIISTSANLSGQPACTTADAIKTLLGDEINVIVEGKTGGLTGPTTIYDLLSGKQLR